MITQPRLDALRTTFSLIYTQAYATAQTDWQRFASSIPSDSESNTYGWLAQQLRLRKWDGQRQAAQLIEHVQEVENDDFEGTVEVPRNKIEDDKLNVYQTQHLPQLGIATAKHPDSLVAEMMLGNVQPGPVPAKGKVWDGHPLYDTDHPNFNTTGEGDTTYQNEFASTALTKENLASVRAEMRSYKGEDGKPLGVRPNLLVVCPELYVTALELTQAANIAVITTNVAGTQNVAASAPTNVLPRLGIECFEWDYLSDFDDLWFLMDTTKTVMPFGRQLRRTPEFVSRTRADDPTVFEKKKYIFGVDYRGIVIPTLPWLQSRAYASATAPEDR
jgi:phage major head subunit gpT-like protein